jgi:hypothetical protein
MNWYNSMHCRWKLYTNCPINRGLHTSERCGMMKRLSLLLILLSLMVATPVLAQTLNVAEGVITTRIVHHQPASQSQSYPASVGKLYCFTRITGAKGDTTITHVWYHDGKEMARVNLPVHSSNWRTWSSKHILPGWTGKWKVEVLDAQGNLLKTIPFTLQ